MKLQIVIPCFNEEKNIPLILDRIQSKLNRNDIGILLVNNGSTDNSSKVIFELLPKYPFAKTINIEVNQGYGYGILTGLKNCDSEYIGWTHADMQTDPYDIIKGLEIIEASKDPKKVYVKGLRKGRSLFDTFFTNGMSLFESFYMKTPLWDINAQPNLFHNSFFKYWSNPPYDFSLDLYALYMAKKNNLKVSRFDVIFPPRIHGSSSWNTGLKSKWKFIKRTIEFSIKLKKEINQ